MEKTISMEITNTDVLLEKSKKCFEELTENKYCKFEDCTLDFVPYKENKYLIYDKKSGENKVVFSVLDIQNAENLKETEHYEFSDITLQFDGNLHEKFSVLKEALNRKIYIICPDIEKVASFYKILEIKSYMKNIKVFKNLEEYRGYFHENTEVYLPRIILADKEHKYEISKIIRNEHKYRLTKEGRNTDNVILTIGIPTHNRGNLLLKRLKNLLRMQYDAEIEIVAAKNGNVLYQEEYVQASKIDDARFVYYGVEDELKPQVNWTNVVKYANGKYVLFISDEDDVVLSALEHYLKMLRTNPKLSMVRARTSLQYNDIENLYAAKGMDAFLKVFLKQNYLSGIIVDREKFIEADVLKYEKYADNAFYINYPHEWWCAEMTMKGDIFYDEILLIDENESVLDEECEQYQNMGIINKNDIFDKESKLPFYSTYESRFKQFKGQIEFISLFLDNDEGKNKMYALEVAINKLGAMVYLARSYGYKKDEFSNVLQEFKNVILESVDEICKKDNIKDIFTDLIDEDLRILAEYDEKLKMANR